MTETDRDFPDFSLTSLGIPLEKRESCYYIDMRPLKLFRGLSVLAGLFATEILESIENRGPDIAIYRKISPEMTPELDGIGLDYLGIFARGQLFRDFASIQTDFQDQMLTVFGTLQRPRWGGALFPEAFHPEVLRNFYDEHAALREKTNSPALLFPFHLHFENKEIDYYFLLERVENGNYLRITIERESDGRLNLFSAPHLVVDDLDRRTYLKGLSRYTDSITPGILKECENLRNLFVDSIQHQPLFFSQLHRAGLSQCESIKISWPAEYSEQLLTKSRENTLDHLKRIFIPLEDRNLVGLISSGSVLQLEMEGERAFLDVSHRGRTLNISIGALRSAHTLERYFARMPILERFAGEHRDILNGYHIFLIHHITSEVLATIHALHTMGCDFLKVLFVKYAGMVPSDYMEVLLSLSDKRNSFHGLQRVETPESIEGYYLLSDRYSENRDNESLHNRLMKAEYGYFEAMRVAAGFFFFQQALMAQQKGRKIIIIEDGGYLAPDLNQLIQNGSTLQDALVHYSILGDDGEVVADSIHESLLPDRNTLSQPLGTWLIPVVPFSVEHTRNGFDRLDSLMEKYEQLSLPALSIAISTLKREMESGEVAVTILHAIESILHSHGLVLSSRKVLLLGSQGAIGSRLGGLIRGRIGEESVLGVDISVPPRSEEKQETVRVLEFATIEELPEEKLMQCDLFVGVVGKSLLNDAVIEKIILNTDRKNLFFASGSTKTVEFTGLAEWLKKINQRSNPSIGGYPVKLAISPLRDPQTSVIQGGLIDILFTETGRAVRLHLLADLTPINFLYYGVPTETMDPVLTQLLSITAGGVRHVNSGMSYPPRLLALDRDINEKGGFIS